MPHHNHLPDPNAATACDSSQVITAEHFRKYDYDKSSRSIRDQRSLPKDAGVFLPANVTFELVKVGEHSDYVSVSFQNIGYNDIDLRGISIMGDYSIATPAFTRVKAGESVSFLVRFSPETEGLRPGGIYLSFGSSSAFCPLNGYGFFVITDEERQVILDLLGSINMFSFWEDRLHQAQNYDWPLAVDFQGV